MHRNLVLENCQWIWNSWFDLLAYEYLANFMHKQPLERVSAVVNVPIIT